MSIKFATESSTALRNWKRYPEYRDSGVEWLGEIPAGWEVKQLKRIFRVFNGSTPKSGVSEYWNGDIAWVTPDDLGQLKSDSIKDTARKITDVGYNSCGTTLVPAGNLVLSTRAPIGHLAIASVEFCTNQGCRAFVFRFDDNKRYYYYQFLSARPEFESWGEGSTFKELSKNNLEVIEIASPSIPEQLAIASFLDHKTSHIDTLIAKKERLIALLEEKRAAIISRAVTKGLDPDVPMKDLGVEWLGEIPEGWEVKPLKYVVKTNPEALGENTNSDYIIKYVDIGNVSLKGLLSEPLEMRFENAPSRARRIIRAGDVVVSTVRTYLKAITRFPNPEPNLIVSTGFAVLRPTYTIESNYIYYTVRSNQFVDAIMAHSVGVGYPAINSSVLVGLPFCQPPLEEQHAIAEYLDREIAKIDALITKIHEHIEKVKEYRTALISAAVTGKIDVREATA